MKTFPKQLSIGQRLRLYWQLLLRAIVHLWVRSKVLPDPVVDAGLKLDIPTCYILDSYSLSSLLILDKACEKHGLSRPLFPMENGQRVGSRSWAALRQLKGLLLRRYTNRRSSDMLKMLTQYALENPEFEAQLVPVTVLIGRAPDKEDSITKLMFSESWEIASRLRRLFSTLINGRDTFVYYGTPISLRSLVDEKADAGIAVRKISRLARTRIRKTREAAIGPDLSHRRTLLNKVLDSERVKAAITIKAKKAKISPEKARAIAEKNIREIAANYSYSMVKIGSLILTWFWNKLYKGVELRHFKEFEKIAHDKEIIYVPCHRSHIDYLLMSYLLYHHGHVPPHIAAGVNLNMPGVGQFLRRGGAFYMRRSFRTNPLYAAVFDEYLSLILSQGVSIEYFIEGTRSRTGRLLPPKAGMLQMTVKAYMRVPTKPIVFQPVYIGYEQLVEGKSYISELSGKEKKSESLLDFFGLFKVLRRNYGKAHVNFGEPIFLDDLLEKAAPGWRKENSEEKPKWLNPLIDELATTIMTNINRTADVNPINLLAICLLASTKHTLAEDQLEELLALYLSTLKGAPLSSRVTITELSPVEIIGYGIELGVIEKREHTLGDIITVTENAGVLLTYFRNNVSHLFVLPSFIASCFLMQSQISRSRLQALFHTIYPYLRSELFLPWDRATADQTLLDNIEVLKTLNLITGTDTLKRAKGGSETAASLNLMGRGLLQTFQRYFITIAVLVKNGSGVLSRAELEKLCTLTAQRISMLHEFDAPEFYDKTLFRQFIGNLTKADVLRRDNEGKLIFDEVLKSVTNDAKLFMSKELRHGIIQIASEKISSSKAEKA
ncbi:MAG: glycerol-3-phosphate 1-O-acyltransferase PlsB [Xanthomonadales bacterium]|nr:glycerol-3-phosphate 1-O-acyltransferase PlsB [Xanthomonadales bacterium]